MGMRSWACGRGHAVVGMRSSALHALGVYESQRIDGTFGISVAHE